MVQVLFPMHLERGALAFVLCNRCSASDYRESLNALHRRIWEAQHLHGA